MLHRLRRFLDVRPGEGLSVLLSFLYIALVVASFLLAKPIRNGLFLEQYSPYSLVYVYAAVPIALTLFVPLYSRAVARFDPRLLTLATLCSLPSTSSFFGTRSASTPSGCCRGSSSSGSTVSGSSRRCRRGASRTRCSTRDRRSGSSASLGPARRLVRLPAACWRGTSSCRSAARSTCCSCWRH